jgi:hypothetical protein
MQRASIDSGAAESPNTLKPGGGKLWVGRNHQGLSVGNMPTVGNPPDRRRSLAPRELGRHRVPEAGHGGPA